MGELHAASVHDPAELPCLAYATVVMAPCAGGLAESGLPDDGDGTKARCWVYARRRAGADLAAGAGEVIWLGGSTQTLEEHGRRVGEATAMPNCLVAGAYGPRLSLGRESDTSEST